MKYIILIILFLVAVAAIISILSIDLNSGRRYKRLPTDFIEPLEYFLYCYEDDECIKIRASACPPSKGGSETCVEKDHFQQYISMIDELAGKEWETTCPDIYRLGNHTCKCTNGKCVLVSL